MSRRMFACVGGLIVCSGWLAVTSAWPQQKTAEPPVDLVQQRLTNLEESLQHATDALARNQDDQFLFSRLEDLAEVDKVRYTGPPPRVVKNPTAQGAGNAVILTAYTFLPKKHLSGGKLPLIVLVHGGIHGNFDSSHVHILRELLRQGYAVLAPEYRGSSGYG
jgi:dipeptidyl aminopeptidase/acylaminoacyl peptidase